MHRYGPHRPEDAPAALPNPDRRIADLIAVPEVMARQREGINRLAHEYAMAVEALVLRELEQQRGQDEAQLYTDGTILGAVRDE